MIAQSISRSSIGLGVTPAEAVRLAEARTEAAGIACTLDFLNLGFDPGEVLDESLGARLTDAGLWTVIHAVDLNLASNASAARVENLKIAADILEPRWIEEDLGSWVWKEAYLGSHQLEPELSEVTARIAARVVTMVSKRLERPFLVENPPIYLARGEHDMWTHLDRVSELANCGLVIDVGHMIGSYINTDREPLVAERDWPGWARVREVHFSGFEITRRRGKNCWFDNHSMRFPPLLLSYGAQVFDRLNTPVAVTLELDGAPLDVVEVNIAVIQELMQKTLLARGL